MKKEIIDILEEFRTPCSFSKGISEKMVLELEMLVKVPFPRSYRQFLTLYGAGGLRSLYVFGVETTPVESSLYLVNNQLKQERMPAGLLAIVDVDEYHYCLETNLMNDNECPVVIWSKHSPNYPPNFSYTSFESFLYDKLTDIVEDILDDL